MYPKYNGNMTERRLRKLNVEALNSGQWNEYKLYWITTSLRFLYYPYLLVIQMPP